jgi:hypothetical protein
MKNLILIKMKTQIKKSLMAMFVTVAAISAIFTSCKKEAEDLREQYVGSFRTNYEYTFNGQQFTGTYTLTIVKYATN